MAAPAFRTIVEKALALRGQAPIPPSERFVRPVKDTKKSKKVARAKAVELPDVVVQAPPKEWPEGQLPDFRGKSLRQALQAGRELGRVPAIDGWGAVWTQAPEPGTPMDDVKELRLTLRPRSPLSAEPSGSKGPVVQ